jgi:ATP-dependent helicase/nuclease subunit B
MTDQSNAAPKKKPAVPAGIYTVAPALPFLDTVAAGILARVGDDPLKLSDITVLVPDRETGYLLRQAFMERMGGRPGVLPRIDAPGDINEKFLSLRVSGNPVLSEMLMDVPPPVSVLDRQLILAAEIMKLPGMASSPQKAVQLGGELGRFIDELQASDIELTDDIDRLVPEAFKAQWARTSEFLKIVTDTWPRKLREMGRTDPEAHRNALIQIQAAHWRENPPSGPVVAVGFTDAPPAVSSLLQSVAAMPQGAIVLPGVDLGLDAASWDVLTPVHPQHAFKKMLLAIGVDRAQVQPLGAPPADFAHARANDPAATNAAREKLLREAMRPAGTAEGWSHIEAREKPAPRKRRSAKKDADGAAAPQDKTVIDVQALGGMDLITCGTPQEEASVIALKMRETLEAPGRTAMLVTADRSLARRVSARLRYWNIEVSDGAGATLGETQAGIFLRATAQMAAESWAPVPFLEAMRHPLAALSGARDDFQQKVAILEDKILRGPRPDRGAEGMKGALTDAFNRAALRKDKNPDPQKLAAEKAELDAFVDRIAAAGKDFFALVEAGAPQPFNRFLDAHIRFAEALAATKDKPGADALWRGDDGVQGARFLTRLRDAAQHIPDVTGQDYADMLSGLMRDVSVRQTKAPHPFLKILTPQQAEFVKADVVIIGGLNDEVWPVRPSETRGCRPT